MSRKIEDGLTATQRYRLRHPERCKAACKKYYYSPHGSKKKKAFQKKRWQTMSKSERKQRARRVIAYNKQQRMILSDVYIRQALSQDFRRTNHVTIAPKDIPVVLVQRKRMSILLLRERQRRHLTFNHKDNRYGNSQFENSIRS